MKTRKLYEDPYMRSHRAKILALEEGAVLLDETIFYPEGGGQLADQGYIQGLRVLDVQEKDGKIYHYLESLEGLYIGREVSLDIDWDNRFNNMQQHTGEHILSGLARSIFGTENVGFDIGRDMMRVDYDKVLSWEDLGYLERKANEAIAKNVPIVSFYPRKEVLDSLPYRSKKELEGDVRIIEVKGYDICTCCGTHVRQTGEVGLLKIISRENYKGGVRLGVLAGFRGLSYFGDLVRQATSMSQSLCAPMLELVPALDQVYQDREAIKRESVKKDEELIRLKLESVSSEGGLLVFEEVLKGKSLKKYIVELGKNRSGLLAVFSPREAGLDFVLISPDEDISQLGRALLDSFGGRGGGRGINFRGSLELEDSPENREVIEKWLKKYM